LSQYVPEGTVTVSPVFAAVAVEAAGAAVEARADGLPSSFEHANAVTATTQTTNRQTAAARCRVSFGRFLEVCSFGKFIDSGVRRRRVRVVSTDLR